ncbi:Rossmann fold domain-containing protein [Altererythrobacter sp. ZODW24]|uniref:Rossmann fold domain-containing protein n=1 Tax=Altererythrobacter sp. ZODW24 TaxID=2185142 RepID=UPI000DF82FFD|nr:hypothetical protein [Altererythrobacter sp. ZODW24]
MQTVLRIEELPEEALEAAALFYAEHVPALREALSGEAGSLVVVMPAAAHDHAAWRRAAVQDLAREAAPKRVNFASGDNADAMTATLEYLANAPGVTGQLLPVDGAAATITP